MNAALLIEFWFYWINAIFVWYEIKLWKDFLIRLLSRFNYY